MKCGQKGLASLRASPFNSGQLLELQESDSLARRGPFSGACGWHWSFPREMVRVVETNTRLSRWGFGAQRRWWHGGGLSCALQELPRRMLCRGAEGDRRHLRGLFAFEVAFPVSLLSRLCQHGRRFNSTRTWLSLLSAVGSGPVFCL